MKWQLLITLGQQAATLYSAEYREAFTLSRADRIAESMKCMKCMEMYIVYAVYHISKFLNFEIHFYQLKAVPPC